MLNLVTGAESETEPQGAPPLYETLEAIVLIDLEPRTARVS